VALLIVDDNETVLRALARVVGGACPVVTAGSARSAIEVAGRVGVDAVVSDLDLGPESEDGVWLLTQVARRWPRVRRVLLTGSPDGRAHAALRDGIVEALLIKPASRASLLRAAVTEAKGERREPIPRSGG
jgi:DNA-binding NtrC family response regulator